MNSLLVRRMAPGEENVVAALIHHSTNAWYQAHGSGGPIFPGDPSECRVFPDTYERLDPGCCIVAFDGDTLVGSCFFHPRPTHLSVGIVNTDSAWAGRGVAGQMLAVVFEEADRRRLPVRLVSSLGNLDSFSLYTRHGFVPVGPVFQDMMLPRLSRDHLPAPTGPDDARVRPATVADGPVIAARETALTGLSRPGDWQYFLETPEWHVSVLTSDDGSIDSALASSAYPASRLIGPGFAATEVHAAALLRAELVYRAGENAGASPVFLVPVTASGLVAQCYRWGARNLELHIAQVRPVPGTIAASVGKGALVFPTFLPETA